MRNIIAQNVKQELVYSSNFIIAQEAIDFQKDKFAKEFVELIGKFREEDIKNNTKFSDYEVGKQIQELVRNRFKMNIDLFIRYEGASIYLPIFDLNHIFFNSNIFFKSYSKKDLEEHESFGNNIKAITDKVNSVNRLNATVSGGFSEVLCEVQISVKLLKNKAILSDSEVGAILLHEFGHGFTLIEYSSKLVVINEMLAIVCSDSFTKADDKVKEYVVKYITDSGDNNPDVAKVINEGSTLKRQIVFLQGAWKNKMSGLGSMNYNDTNCESLADNFASRFGFGLDLAKALDKIYISPENKPVYRYLKNTLELWRLISLVGVLTGIIGVSPLILTLSVVALLINLSQSGETNHDYTYDRFQIRLKRIREQMIQDIKNNKIPDKDARVIIDSLDEVDKIISKTVIFNTFLSKILNFIFTSNRNALKSVEGQRLLEEIASNDLYVSAAKLKTFQ